MRYISLSSSLNEAVGSFPLFLFKYILSNFFNYRQQNFVFKLWVEHLLILSSILIDSIKTSKLQEWSFFPFSSMKLSQFWHVFLSLLFVNGSFSWELMTYFIPTGHTNYKGLTECGTFQGRFSWSCWWIYRIMVCNQFWLPIVSGCLLYVQEMRWTADCFMAALSSLLLHCTSIQ